MPQTDMSPSRAPFTITPHDTNPIGKFIRGFTVQVAGNVKVTCADGTTPTLPLPAGMCPAEGITHIWSTGTTATGFVGYP